MSLYLILMLGSVSVPLILSFDKKLQFYKQWKTLLPAILVVAAFFIAVDVLYTHWGVWGFNAQHHSNIYLLGLPLEEWLFFIAIPYACVFLHDAILLYFDKFRLTRKITKYITLLLLVLSVFLILMNTEKAYTLYISVTIALVLIVSLFDASENTQSFYLTFLVMLVPFLIVNGVLTGSFLEEPIVWYDNAENLGIRIFTIPVEDTLYAFSQILLTLMLKSKLNSIVNKNKTPQNASK